MKKPREILTQLAGGASVCWDKEGVFESTKALEFTDQALTALAEWVEGEKKSHAINMVTHKEYHRNCPYCEQNLALSDIAKKLKEEK